LKSEAEKHYPQKGLTKNSELLGYLQPSQALKNNNIDQQFH
jgi:hypothetical protein